MILDTVILASDDNPDYLDFWPIVSEAWESMGLEPILIYTGQEKKDLKGNIIKYNPNKLDSAFVAQNIRLLYPGILKNKNCIISDIDLLPLSKNYFYKSVLEIPDNKFVIYRPDAGLPDNMISMMWNAANSDTWMEIFQINNESDIQKKLKKWYSRKYSIRGSAWYTDQLQLKKHIDKFSKKNNCRIHKLDDKINGFNRFNRTKLSEHLDQMNSGKSNFSDFHMPRPFKKYESLINDVYIYHKKNISSISI